MLANGKAEHHEPDAIAAVREAYARGESDEFVVPTIVGQTRPVKDGDACIFFNFRPDRARQLTLAFNADPAVPFQTKKYQDFIFATMAEEWGLAGGIFIFVCWAVIIGWGMGVALGARTQFARLAAAGLACTLFFYVLINAMMLQGKKSTA